MRLKMILLFALFLMSARTYSQDTKAPQLYWVVETNSYYRDYTVVRLYNEENIEVYEVKIMGVNIDVRFSKQRKILDQLVKEYLERALSSAERMTTEHVLHIDGKDLRDPVTKRQF